MLAGTTVRKILLGLALTAAAWSLPARADEPGKTPRPASGQAEPDVGPAAFLDRFKVTIDGLKLTDEVQKKADALFDAARKELASLDHADPAEMRKKAHEVFEKLRKDVGNLLTNEQKLEISKKLQGIGTGLVIDKIKQQLNRPEMKLTEEQKKQLEEILDETKHKLEELRAEAQSGAKDSGAKLKDILQEMREKLNQILSPDQLKGQGGAAPKPDTAPKKD